MSLGSPPADPANTDAPEVARALVIQRNLVPVAFGHLTVDALTAVPFHAVSPTKALLKRFFSDESWTDADAGALAEAAGPGEGWWSRALDDKVALEYGWRDGRFAIGLSLTAAPPVEVLDDPPPADVDSPMVPETTPDPRTLRFRTGPIHDTQSLRSARLFDQFPEIAHVLVGPDFVDVSLRRAADWDRLLGHVQAAVADVFAGAAPTVEPRWLQGAGPAGGRRRSTARSRRAARLALAWAELGPLRPADTRDLETLITASHNEDQVRRQVSASLLLEADPAVAATHWERLLDDPSRSVRRATVDAMADAGRGELRPLLERALGDDDGWVRWKALRGLGELGAGPSRDAISALHRDRDFRVRVEVANMLEASEPAL